MDVVNHARKSIASNGLIVYRFDKVTVVIVVVAHEIAMSDSSGPPGSIATPIGAKDGTKIKFGFCVE